MSALWNEVHSGVRGNPPGPCSSTCVPPTTAHVGPDLAAAATAGTPRADARQLVFLISAGLRTQERHCVRVLDAFLASRGRGMLVQFVRQRLVRRAHAGETSMPGELAAGARSAVLEVVGYRFALPLVARRYKQRLTPQPQLTPLMIQDGSRRLSYK